MNVQINDDYRLISDKHNVILQEKYEKVDNETKEKTGKFDFKDVGYYPTVEMALKGFLRKATLNSKATNLKELLEEIKSIRKLISELAGN
ncbi:hypothetical protein [Bacillus cereus]|uniref:DUF5405 domain-containing protein n=1 Tax=Bacillus cereus TaxID=1396 RepID=A0A9X8NUS8_BACCE|nr:hypothetical protein [Bacillus cereus]RWQ72960.1 hypothetical protein DR116_0016660 [Bacillus cereus]